MFDLLYEYITTTVLTESISVIERHSTHQSLQSDNLSFHFPFTHSSVYLTLSFSFP